VRVWTVTFRVDGQTVATAIVDDGTAVPQTLIPEVAGRDGLVLTGWSASLDNITGNITVDAVFGPPVSTPGSGGGCGNSALIGDRIGFAGLLLLFGGIFAVAITAVIFRKKNKGDITQ